MALTALFAAGVWTGLSGAGQGVRDATTLSLTAKLDAAQEVPKPRAPAGAAARSRPVSSAARAAAA